MRTSVFDTYKHVSGGRWSMSNHLVFFKGTKMRFQPFKMLDTVMRDAVLITGIATAEKYTHFTSDEGGEVPKCRYQSFLT